MKNLTLLCTDILAIMLAFCLGQTFRIDDFAGQPLYSWWHLEGIHRAETTLAAGLVMILFMGWSKRHYSLRSPFWDEITGILRALWLGIVVDGALMYFNKWQFSRLAFGLQWISLLFLLPFLRYAVKSLLLKQGLWQTPVTLIGGGPNAREAWNALRSERLMGFALKEVLLTPGQTTVDWTQATTRTLDGEQPVRDQSRQVVIALEAHEQDIQEQVLRALSRTAQNIIVVPPARRLPLLGMEPLYVFSHEVLFLRAQNLLQRPLARLLKRSFDITVACLLLLLLSPLFAVLVLRIRRDGGPAFFGHSRIGRDEHSFPCYKFRTMVTNSGEVLEQLLKTDPVARQEWESEFKLKNDPRITAVGQFLRRTSLDELPQLWNVLRGEMSLVGPRPVIRDELEKYGEDVSYYLQVRPGMTGLWQVSGRNDVDYDTRVALDAWYVRNWSLWHDIVILIKTVRVVLGRDGAY